MLNCRDVGQLLHDYVEGLLTPLIQQQLEQHLADCPNCTAFLNTYRQTIRVSRELRCEEIPQELKEKLQSFLKTKLSHRPNLFERLRLRITGFH